jgi:hypothetical protein
MPEFWVFTGPSQGMWHEQVRSLIQLAKDDPPWRAVHGDCIGSDATFHMTLTELCARGDIPSLMLETYPGYDKDGKVRKRAWCPAGVVHPAAPMMDRNRAMIRRGIDENRTSAHARLIATPAVDHLISHGGTSFTIKYALSCGLPVTMIWPSGSVVRNWRPDIPGTEGRKTARVKEETR